MDTASKMMLWEYNGIFGIPTDCYLTIGEFDEYAEDVFSKGHCHSLALALHELIEDSDLVGVYDGEADAPDHVAVRLRDGRFLDARGLHEDEDDFMDGVGYGEGVVDMDVWDVELLGQTGFYRHDRTEDAKSFARALMEREGVETGDLVAA
jgi:hypothetical protein